MQFLQHLARMGDRFGAALDHDALAACVDIDAQPLLQRQDVAVIFAEQLRQQLGTVERHLDTGALTLLGGDGLAAHAVLSGETGLRTGAPLQERTAARRRCGDDAGGMRP